MWSMIQWKQHSKTSQYARNFKEEYKDSFPSKKAHVVEDLNNFLLVHLKPMVVKDYIFLSWTYDIFFSQKHLLPLVKNVQRNHLQLISYKTSYMSKENNVQMKQHKKTTPKHHIILCVQHYSFLSWTYDILCLDHGPMIVYVFYHVCLTLRRSKVHFTKTHRRSIENVKSSLIVAQVLNCLILEFQGQYANKLIYRGKCAQTIGKVFNLIVQTNQTSSHR